MKYIIINISSTLIRSWSTLSWTSLLVYLDNRRVFLFHFCDAVYAVTLGLWHRSHGQTKQGALNKECKLEEMLICLYILHKKLPRGRIQQWSCWSTASWTLEARRSQPGRRQLSRNQIHMLRFLSRGYIRVYQVISGSYMQKTCDVAEKAILAKKNLRKKCVNRDKM